MMRVVTIALVALVLAANLTACGRKGAPEYPPGTTYPGQYPSE